MPKYKITVNKLNDKGLVQLIALFVLVIGLIATLYLVKQRTNILPFAYEQEEPMNIPTLADDKFAPPMEEDPTMINLSGTVFWDVNGNKVWDFNEIGVGGVTIEVGVGTGATRKTVTNENGLWSIKVPEDYSLCSNCGKINITPPNGWEAIIDTLDVPVYSNIGTTTSGLNFPVQGIYSVSGTVFKDTNSNKQQDSGESGINGVLVVAEVFGIKNTRKDSFGGSYTNSDGSFVISHLPPANQWSVYTWQNWILAGPALRHVFTTKNPLGITSPSSNVLNINFGIWTIL